MNIELLQDAIGEIDDGYILEAHQANHIKTRRPVWRKVTAIVAAAACLALMLAGGFHALNRLDYLKASCGSFIGVVCEGEYYYYVPHDGIYCYAPGGKSEKLLGKYYYDTWRVNDYGLYYTRGRSLYVLPHGEDKAQKLFETSIAESSHLGIGFSEGGVVLTVYNKRKGWKYQLLLDGKTGEVIKSLGEKVALGENAYSDTVFAVGQRTLTLVGDSKDVTMDLQENGTSLLPKGCTVYKYPMRFGDNLEFMVYDANNPDNSKIFIARTNGVDTLLQLDNAYYILDGTDNGDYLFYSEDNALYCIDTFSSETWELSMDAEHDFCDFTTDGNYIYTCAPWDTIQSCWQIIYDGGRPTELHLVEQDIIEK